MAKSYESKDIVVLEGLDAVRMRPGMYIGTTGIKGLHHILWEIVDNAIDEITNGFGNKMTVTLHKDGSASVEDNGRGVPVDEHPTLKKSGVEVVFTQLHAGGKFNNENYGYSGGLHGVGASVTNALSEWLKVVVCKDKKKYQMDFASPVVNGKIKSGIPTSPLICLGDTAKSGTKVTFMPDKRVFESVNFNAETIMKRLKELALLNRGIFIEFVDERSNIKQMYCYEGGISDFVRYLNEGKTTLYKDPIFLSGESKVLKMEIAIQHTDSYTENTFSYVNNIPTTEGGTHETGFKSALTRAMNEIARREGFLKEKEQNLMGEDFREGMTAVIAIKMRNIQFEGQTKTKLGNPEARVDMENLAYNELIKFFDKKENNATFEAIINKAKGAAKTREASRKAKELTRQKIA